MKRVISSTSFGATQIIALKETAGREAAYDKHIQDTPGLWNLRNRFYY